MEYTLTCPECDWTDIATGDRTTDNMLLAAHRGGHMTEAEQRRAERQAQNPDAWYS